MKRKFLILFLFLLTVAAVSAQDVFLQEGDPSTEEEARTLVEHYQPELVMTGTQTRLFERKLSEFLLRAEKIKAMDISTEDRLHMLHQLSEQETEEMTNILTRPQVKRYVRLKPKFQPIAMVVDSVKSKKQ
jgi:uncharacterized protein (DUF1778 family)